MKKLILLGCFLLIVIQLQAATAAELIVGGTDSPYQSIQAAVDAAADGDTLLLNPGVFDSTGDLNIDCGSKSLTIQSRDDDPESCVIDCRREGRAFFVYGGETLTLRGLTIRNGLVSDHNRGGAIYCFEATLNVENCIFENNQSLASGGAVAGYAYYENSSFTATFTDCTFTGNSAINGGAVSGEVKENDSNIAISQLTFTNCFFTMNTAAEKGGAIAQDYKISTSCQECRFTDNKAANLGGAVCVAHYDESSSHITASTTTTTFTRCHFDSNCITATSLHSEMTGGGAIYGSYTKMVKLDSCVLTGNQSLVAGAILSLSSIQLQNSLITRNISTLNTTFTNSVVYCTSGRFTNCTIAFNQGFTSGALFAYALNLQNTILWGNNPAGLARDDNYTVSYCDIQGNYAEGTGNIATDPLFVNADEGDFHLCPNSPCIDSGCSNDAPSNDLEGNPRSVGDGFDMGVYEFSEILVWQASSNDWDEPANWQPSQVPNHCVNIRIEGEMGDGPIVKSTEAAARTLEIRSGCLTIGIGGRLNLGSTPPLAD